MMMNSAFFPRLKKNKKTKSVISTATTAKIYENKLEASGITMNFFQF